MSDTNLISIIIVLHNNQDDIRECLKSILNQSYTNFEIILVDNNSVDKTKKIITDEFLPFHSNIILIENKENLFYAGGNNAGFKKSRGKWIAILNPDIIVDNEWLNELMFASNKYSDVVIFCSNVLHYDDRSSINACGNEMHISGLVFSRLYTEKECICKEEDILLPSGAAFLFEKKIVRETCKEPFDDMNFPMEFSDIDFALRLTSINKRCKMIPSSRVYHKYIFKMNSTKFQYLEMCRYKILGHISHSTKVLMIPIFILTEIVILSFALKNGFLLKKLSLYPRLLSLPKLNVTNSKEKDYKIISKMTPYLKIYPQFKEDRISKIIISVFNSFFKWQKSNILSRLAQ